MNFGLLLSRTLATDRGFKERVREDMLVRLLDAFVWRSHGNRVLIIGRPIH
jgi:cell cycle arrest protein BUB2